MVIKYVPYVGDSKRALDEYTSELMLGGTNTLVLHNTCEVCGRGGAERGGPGVDPSDPPHTLHRPPSRTRSWPRPSCWT